MKTNTLTNVFQVRLWKMADNVTTAFLQFSGVQQNKRCKTFNFTLKCVHFLRFNCHAQKNTKFDATAVQPAVRFILAVWIAHMLFTCMHIAQPHRHLIARSFKAFAHSIRIAISMHFNTMWSKHDTRASKKTFHFFLSLSISPRVNCRFSQNQCNITMPSDWKQK